MLLSQALLQHIGKINATVPLLPALGSVLLDSAFSIPLKKGAAPFSSFSGAFATYRSDQCCRAAFVCARLCFAQFCVFRTAEKGRHPFCSFLRRFCNILARSMPPCRFCLRSFSVPLKKGAAPFVSFSGAFATYWQHQYHRAAFACARLCFARFRVFRTAEKGHHPFFFFLRRFCNILERSMPPCRFCLYKALLCLILRFPYR